jgi:hypothetical protein
MTSFAISPRPSFQFKTFVRVNRPSAANRQVRAPTPQSAVELVSNRAEDVARGGSCYYPKYEPTRVVHGAQA